QHGKIAIDDRFVIAAYEGGPGIDAHRIAGGLPMHLRLSTDGHLVHAVRQLAFAEDGLNLLRVQRALGRVDVRRDYLALPPSRLFHVREKFPDRRGELRFIAHASNVHEHHFWRIPKEMVVQRSHFEPVVQGSAHRRIHLLLGHHHVPHHHRSIAVALERGPAGEPHRWRHFYACGGDGQIRPRHRYLEDTFLRVEGALGSGELLDARGVELGTAVLLWSC